MAELDVFDLNNAKVGKVQASAAVFESKVHEHLVHQYVVTQLAGSRRGTACTISDYNDITGSGKKPWRQKGTGRARQGKTRAAQWRGGLTIFGPTPRSYALKMSKTSKRLALRSVLTDGLQNGKITVVKGLDVATPKTKDAAQLIKKLGLPEKTLFIVDQASKNFKLAVRNLPTTAVLDAVGINVYDLLYHDKIVFTPESLKKIEERLGDE
jgi:large subunit ribosomal protein L4